MISAVKQTAQAKGKGTCKDCPLAVHVHTWGMTFQELTEGQFGWAEAKRIMVNIFKGYRGSIVNIFLKETVRGHYKDFILSFKWDGKTLEES